VSNLAGVEDYPRPAKYNTARYLRSFTLTLGYRLKMSNTIGVNQH